MDSLLNNYNTSNFTLRIQLFNIQKRLEPQEFPDLPIFAHSRNDYTGARNEYTGSHNEHTGSSRDSPNRNYPFNAMSTRLPETRGASPFNSYGGQDRRPSPRFNNRRPSPSFSNPCKHCYAHTSNRSGICNNCVNRH